MSQSVAYVLLHFPYLTETFVAEEIQSIRSQGIDVRIISLLDPGPGPVQPLSHKLLSHTWYAPGLMSYDLWKSQIRFLCRSPCLYLKLLVRLLRQPYPRQAPVLLAKRLVVFLKAVAVAHYLEDSDVGLLHSHFAWLSGAAAWVCARWLGLPFTVTVHAYDIYYSNDLLSLVSGEASHIIAISDYNRQQLAALETCPAENISVIHCGVNLSSIQQPSEQEERHSTDEPISVLSVGSLVAKKGHVYLVDACRLLKQRGIDVNCTIIGGGPLEQDLRQHIREYGLHEQVTLLGPRPHPEVMDAYRRHDLFVLASVVTPGGDRDGIPVVLMEAGAMGLALISTRVSGIPELVRHGQTGWLVPPSDASALAEAIAMMSADPALRWRFGQNARALVEDEFDVERNSRRLASLFRSIC